MQIKLRPLFFGSVPATLSLASVALALAACVGATSESVGDQESANTADAGTTATTDSGPAQPDAPTTEACSQLAAGPLQPQALGQVFSGSEDFTFDGRGHIVGKRGAAMALVGREGATTLAQLPGTTWGVRYLPNGNLIAALPQAGKLVNLSPAGEVTDLLTGLGGPNGIYVDASSNVWFTEFQGAKVSRLAPDGTRTTLAAGTPTAQGADGIVLDEQKRILFYNEYQKGKINRIAVDVPGALPVPVATIAGAAVDGMVLDACGNLYVVDNGRSRLFRVRIAADGSAAAEPELLATFPTNVAAANFGSGDGFDPKKLYLTGNPGTVYAVDVGIGGAPVPTPWTPAPEQPARDQ